MENQNRWNLDSDAVISGLSPIFKDLKTGTVEEFMQKFKQIWGDMPLLNDGVPCRVLEPGKHWQEGRVRIAIEFYPEEPEEPEEPEDEPQYQ